MTTLPSTTPNQPTSSENAAPEMSKKEMHALVFKFNFALVIEKLQAVGCTLATIEYSGEGDSGNSNDITLTPHVDIDNIDVTRQYLDTSYNANTRQWDSTIIEMSSSLGDVLDDICNDTITRSGNDGYENGDGGGGSFTIDVQAGQVKLNHYHNVIEQNYFNYVLNPETGAIAYSGSDEEGDLDTALIGMTESGDAPSPSA